MGIRVAETITVATENGPVVIKTEEIEKIEKAPDGGAYVVHSSAGKKNQVLTVESFLRVISYFNRM